MAIIASKKMSTFMLFFIFLISWINPIWPAEQALHNSLTVVGLFILWHHNKRYNINSFDYLLIIIFLSVHTIAARWLYSNVPYDDWLHRILGFSLNNYLGFERNNFDRLVHFLYGLCLTPSIISFITNKFNTSNKISFALALSAIMITSLWYEWFEWIVALTLSEDNAEAYNGQQGDMWDAHKDILMATIGSLMWSHKLASPKTAK